MDSSSDAALALLGLGMLIPLVLGLILLAAGIYVLYCLSRAANALDRLAHVAETRLAREVAAARAINPPPKVPQTGPATLTQVQPSPALEDSSAPAGPAT